MSKVEVAKSYAKALYEVNKEAGQLEKALNEIYEVVKAFEQNPAAFTLGEEAISALSTLKLSSNTLNLLKIMAQKSRLSVLPLVYEEYQDLIDRDMGVLRGTVTSAKVLNSNERKEIEAYVEKATGKKSILSYQEDPSVLGGFSVSVGSTKIEASLKHQINKMKTLFTNGAN